MTNTKPFHTIARAGVFFALSALLCVPAALLAQRETQPQARVRVAQDADWLLLDGARVHPDYRGLVPKKSDVIFSTRFKRPEAPEVAKAFAATRSEWVYSTDKEFVNALGAVSGGWFGGALNSNASGVPQVKPPSDAAMAKDFDGNSLIHHLMKAWGGPKSTPTTHPGRVVTTTHPETQKVLREQARLYLELGADSIQHDDPMLQVYSGIYLGGDFNPTTLAGFNKWLNQYSDKEELRRVGLDNLRGDYREFLKTKFGIRDAQDYMRRHKTLPTTPIWFRYLRQTVREHFLEFRKFLNATSGKQVPLSMNLGILEWPDEKKWHFFLAPLASYAMAETPIDKTWELASRAATTRAFGIGYAPSLKPRSRAENRVAIATFYALGGVPLVPWDVYEGNDEKGQAKRFFGRPEDYGDLYAFVRKHPQLLDDKELAAVVGIPVPVHKFNTAVTSQLVKRLADNRVPFAFILTGGSEDKFRVNLDRARHFKALVMANADSDFRPIDLREIQSLPVHRINAAQLSEETLRGLSPFVAAGEAIALKLYPRATMKSANKNLLIHVIDEAKGELRAIDPACRRRIGITKAFTGQRKIANATWYSGETATKLTITDGTREVLVTIPECKLWGVLSFDL